MTYKLEFKVSALKEWQKLDRPIREQFKKKTG
jgi:mRNA interferase RelE/StbE